ncbi:hypothetical protein [Cupriavidus sp. USMAHM13]|uniref:hypothetical protein n=1 Tax=Cupriavidus sp. USMAHM13 TaxID=1389192 RepID=UPI0012EAD866|nr:hypothetical protein [Cupriavidus sp. USMAHM13]
MLRKTFLGLMATLTVCGSVSADPIRVNRSTTLKAAELRSATFLVASYVPVDAGPVPLDSSSTLPTEIPLMGQLEGRRRAAQILVSHGWVQVESPEQAHYYLDVSYSADRMAFPRTRTVSVSLMTIPRGDVVLESRATCTAMNSESRCSPAALVKAALENFPSSTRDSFTVDP